MSRLDRLAGVIRALGHDETGATALEYGLIIALIFITAISALGLMSGNATDMIKAAMARISEVLAG